jgi:hypothetical protein
MEMEKGGEGRVEEERESVEERKVVLVVVAVWVRS